MDLLLCLSEAYFDEFWAQKMASREGVTTLDLRHLEGTHCYCDGSASDAIRAALSPFGPEGRHWIDTGDYHYLSLFWMEKVSEPFDLLLLDNHPDDQAPVFGEEILSCGSWVRKAQGSLPLLRQVYRNDAPPPSKLPLYISVDLDVLSREWVRTDWSQGGMSLDDLELILTDAASKRRIIGADICGGLTKDKGAAPQDLRLNVSTRERLLDILERLSIS